MKARIAVLILAAIFLAACTMPYSSAPAQIPAAEAPTLMPTVTAAEVPTLEPITEATLVPTSAPVVSDPTQSNGWTITWFSVADKDRGDGTTFRQSTSNWNWRKIAPELWPTFPNVPNPLVSDFRVVPCVDDPTKQCVPDGLESAMDESNFCQQLAGESCRVPVAAEHYLLFTGDYNIPNIGACKEDGTKQGCALVIVNVGGVTSDFTGVFAQGFRIHARYWNGNALDMAMWALTSHTANVMLDMNSTLNPANIQNAGANCSIPTGCDSVNVRVVFVSGNEPMLKLETTVSR